MKALLFGTILSLITLSARADPGNGRLSITTTSPCQIFVDGKPVGRSPVKRISLSPGRHFITYKSKELGAVFEFPLKIRAEKQMSCQYDFETGENRCTEDGIGAAKAEKASLSLRSEPGAEVYLDGRWIGMTPLEKYEVEPGHYKLEFRNSGFKPVMKEVDVAKGQNVQIQIQFAAPSSNSGT